MLAAEAGACQLSMRDIWTRPRATLLLQLQRSSLFLRFALEFMLGYGFENFIATDTIYKNSSVFSIPPIPFSKSKLIKLLIFGFSTPYERRFASYLFTLHTQLVNFLIYL